MTEKYNVRGEDFDTPPSHLKSLDDHRKEMIEKWSATYDTSTGIACPNCGDELHDSSPGVVLCSNPPQKMVECKSCTFTTSVLA